MRSRREDAFMCVILALALVIALAGQLAGNILPTAGGGTDRAVPPIESDFGGAIEVDGDAVLININVADEDALMTLSGIGPALSARIVEYRTQNGAFSSIDELKNVSGIGDAVFDKIRDRLTVGE